MLVLEPGKDDQAAIMASIGNICIQWAMLEANLLAILAALQSVTTEECFIMFGGLDMRPRMNMTINLARHHRIHPRLIKRIENLRKTLDAKKLDEARNRAIHGVHSESSQPYSVDLTMHRLKGDSRTKTVSVADLFDLGMEINRLANEAYSIFNDYGIWKFGEHYSEHLPREFVETDTGLWFKIKQYVSARINHLRGH